MSFTTTIPPVVFQAVADAANITDDSLALFQFSPQHLDIHLTSNAMNYSMDLMLPLNATLKLDSPVCIGVDVSRFAKFRQVFMTDMDIQTTVSSSKHNIRFAQNNLSFRSDLIDSGNIPRATIYKNLTKPEKLVLSGSMLNAVVELAGQISERIMFTMYTDQTPFYVHAIGDTDHVELRCNHASITSLQNTSSEQVNTVVMTKYIQPLQDTIPDTADVLYEIEDDSPLRISYGLPQTDAIVSYCIRRILK